MEVPGGGCRPPGPGAQGEAAPAAVTSSWGKQWVVTWPLAGSSPILRPGYARAWNMWVSVEISEY